MGIIPEDLAVSSFLLLEGVFEPNVSISLQCV